MESIWKTNGYEKRWDLLHNSAVRKRRRRRFIEGRTMKKRLQSFRLGTFTRCGDVQLEDENGVNYTDRSNYNN